MTVFKGHSVTIKKVRAVKVDGHSVMVPDGLFGKSILFNENVNITDADPYLYAGYYIYESMIEKNEQKQSMME